jgi:hypothetical protein
VSSSLPLGVLTDLELATLRSFADVLDQGGYCGDPSPFHGDLVMRAAEEIARLRAQVKRSQAQVIEAEGAKEQAQATGNIMAARVAQFEAALRTISASDCLWPVSGRETVGDIARAALRGTP